MKAQEIDAFKKKYGYPPLALTTSIDMLALYVHKDNPIQGLTLQQVDAIFSRTPRGAWPRRSTPGAIWAWPANGRIGPSPFTAATPPRAPMATSASTPSSAAISAMR